jgi:hypothetical protein
MKKIVSILILSLIVFVSQAQTGRAYVFSLIPGDTLVNADTSVRVIPATAGYSALAISVNVTKLTGSAITGKAYLYQSLDGANYALTDSALYVTNPQFSANLTANIVPTYTATATFQKTTTPSVYYLVAATSTGTVTEKVQFLYTVKQYFITRP